MADERFRSSETREPTDREKDYLDLRLERIKRDLAKKFGSQLLPGFAADLSKRDNYHIEGIYPKGEIEAGKNWRIYEESQVSGRTRVFRRSTFWDSGRWEIEYTITGSDPTKQIRIKVNYSSRERKTEIEGTLPRSVLSGVVSERYQTFPALIDSQLINSLSKFGPDKNFDFVLSSELNKSYILLPTPIR